MTSESVEELVLTDSWAGRHEHVHDDSVDVFIPRWVFWGLGGALVGAIAWLVWVEYQAEKRQLERQREQDSQDKNVVVYLNPGHPLHGQTMLAEEFFQRITLEKLETDKAAPDENAQENPNL